MSTGECVLPWFAGGGARATKAAAQGFLPAPCARRKSQQHAGGCARFSTALTALRARHNSRPAPWPTPSDLRAAAGPYAGGAAGGPHNWSDLILLGRTSCRDNACTSAAKFADCENVCGSPARSAQETATSLATPDHTVQ